MTDTIDTSAATTISALARLSTEPTELEPGKIYALVQDDSVEVVDTMQYQHVATDRPRSVVVRDAHSFLRFVDDWQRPLMRPEAFADAYSARVVAILNPGERATELAERFGDLNEIVTLQLALSQQWKDWLAINREFLPQTEFADWIEEHAEDVISPSAAELVTVARHLSATKSVEFESGQRDSDGQVTFAYKETVTSRAGQRGELTIPEQLEIAIRPYMGGVAYRMSVRFRWRIDANQQLRLGIVIDRTDRVLEQAFNEVVEELRTGVDGISAFPGEIYLGVSH